PVIDTAPPELTIFSPTPAPERPHDYAIEHAAVTELPGEGDERRARFGLKIVNSGGALGPAPLPVTMAIDGEDPRIIHVIERPTEGSIHHVSPIAEVEGGEHVAVFSVAGKSRRLVFDVPAPDLAVFLQPVEVTEDGLLLIAARVENVGDQRARLSEVVGSWVTASRGRNWFLINPTSSSSPRQFSRRIQYLEPGEVRTIQVWARPPQGEHRVAFRVRPFGYDQDLSNNTVSAVFDAQLASLDVVSASAYQLGWPTPQSGLVDISIQIRNQGDHAASVPVGLVFAETIAGSEQPKTALAGLPRCEDVLERGCWLELGRVELAAGVEAAISSRLTLLDGDHELVIFAGDPGRELEGWAGEYFRRLPLQVTAQPATLLRADLSARVTGYYADGTARIELTGSLSNLGARAYLDPVPLAIECRAGDVVLPGCGEQPEITLPDGYGPVPFGTDIEAVMGEQVAVEARFGELARRSIQVPVPERILGVERGLWECYAHRIPRGDRENCSGMWWPGVRKWDQPVRIWHTGDADYLPGLRAAVEKYCPMLNLECEFVDEEAGANVRAYLGILLTRAEEINFLSCVDFGGCARTDFDGSRVNGGRFVAWAFGFGGWARPRDELIAHVIAHELLHIIAPIGHRNDPEFVLSSTIDPVTEALLRLNAHPLLKPGMSLEQARQLVVLDDELLDPRDQATMK
ncbi:MAG: hypothetical protein OXL33_00185, partial [Chloroflexota bacterium]|nr:hypothetical protein [Chloroflexota bacterium]